ncbi:hypothetical protein GBAR_LOCUS29847 [Geodia barretti]|uniref:Uncharacterized protein n=1 Tax=Geodia barretti TaxID=519541 RepID=A0AA35TVW5_GEOBA|nr:hypothetical protein GBAR_LOCUS29847 [Geodia barretti]
MHAHTEMQLYAFLCRVDRPMTKDSRVVEKEVCQPFPAEHPYTSHISQFSLFPDTHTSHPHTTAGSHTHRNIGTQTPATSALLHSAPSYYVAQKAVEKGSRIERHHQFSRGHVTDHMTQQDGYSQLWDLPRSQRHQRSKTYPTPHVQYPTSHSPKPPHTQEALSTIHCLVARTTSYQDHFHLPYGYPHDGPNKTTSRRMSATGGQNLSGSRPLYLSFSHSRPYTAESRSKYKGTPARGDTVGEDCEWEEEEEGEWAKGEVRWVTMKDAATQTEPNDEFPPLGLPHSTNDNQARSTTDGPTIAKTVEMRPSTTGVEQRECSFSVDEEEASFRPRSSITCRRFSQLYGFSRSDTMKHFHSQFLEPVPDLREYGMQKGKRHTIHGYNSYYFH